MEEKLLTEAVPISDYRIDDSFWKQKIDMIHDTAIPYQWNVLNDRIKDAAPSHCIENFRIAAGLSKGEFQGRVFQDSDAYKWLETVGYILKRYQDPELMKTADGLIDLIVSAQQPDGYLDTYYIINGLDKRFTNVANNHELYCAGHMIEAAVAYYQGTGKRRLLDAAIRLAGCIDGRFGAEPGKLHAYPGHEILEMALVRLYHVTGEERFLNLAEYFINERGRSPLYFEEEQRKYGYPFFWKDSYFQYQYYQAGKPVREQLAAEGHAVRAVYLYSGMAAVAREKRDAGLHQACVRLMDDIVDRQMYITGAIGQAEYGESFTFDYDLPNDTIYGETCAAIGLVFFARRMLEIAPSRKYADVIERVIYNGSISGMSAEGTRFFYVNPLEVDPEACVKDEGKRHVKPERQKWFSCACCPPNLARLIASISSYASTRNDRQLFLHQYFGGTLRTGFGNSSLQIKSGFPWDGKVAVTVSGETKSYDLVLRVPGWCTGYTLKINGEEADVPEREGYLSISRSWAEGDRIDLDFEMPVLVNYAHPSVREDVGKIAVSRGPVVYCLEEADNGKNLHRVFLNPGAEFAARQDDMLGGCVTLESDVSVLKDDGWGGSLYRAGARPEFEARRAKWIPYYLWANRGVGEMLVWVHDGSFLKGNL